MFGGMVGWTGSIVSTCRDDEALCYCGGNTKLWVRVKVKHI